MNVRKGLLDKKAGFVEPQCVCSSTGIIRGTNTGQPGCAKHGKESNAHVEAYCYVEGGFECGGAMTSDSYPGLFWVGCEKPNFALLYPPTCEIRQSREAKLYDVPPSLGLETPPATFAASIKNMPALPAEPSPIDHFVKGMGQWSKPMPPLWHAARGNYFVGGTECAYPLTPIDAKDCPVDVTAIAKCVSAPPGSLCDGDGECGTSPELDNCGAKDVYRKEKDFSHFPGLGAANGPPPPMPPGGPPPTPMAGPAAAPPLSPLAMSGPAAAAPSAALVEAPAAAPPASPAAALLMKGAQLRGVQKH